MRIAWITNLPIGPLAKHLRIAESSGSWIYASLREVMLPCNTIYVITTLGISERIELEEDGIKYVALPTANPSEYRFCSKNEAIWTKELTKIAPDILQVWGTEYKHVSTALKVVSKSCRKLVYIQGVMGSIYRYYYGGISKFTLLRYTSVVELLMGKSLFFARKKVLQASKLEEKNIALADGIVLETEWSDNYYQTIIEGVNTYHHVLPINPIFKNVEWNIKLVSRHSIFTPASDYPLKGLHYLIDALRHVKKKCADVKLYVPGSIIMRNSSLIDNLKQKAYRRYIRSLLSKYDLWDNVEFVGILKAEEMAHYMAIANVFVCASVIENHSSTLREAMMVGTPCISTCVGGIPEYLTNGTSGILYSFSDSISLAGNILKVFNSDEVATSLSRNARFSIEKYYSNKTLSLQDLYLNIV